MAADVTALIAEAHRDHEGRRHFLALDSLRGIFACAVAVFHFQSDGYISRSALMQHAGTFVDFFFVLSGFVIMASYGNRLRGGFSPMRFMALRLGRLYPLHLTMLVALAAIQIVAYLAGSGGVGARDGHLVPSFIMTLSLSQIFGYSHNSYWNPPTWSIAAEIWSYLGFALVCRLSGRFFLAMVIAVVIVAPLMTPDYVFTITTGALPRCAYSFGIGVLCYTGWTRCLPAIGRLSFVQGSLAETLAIAAALTAMCTFSPAIVYFCCPWIFALVILLLSLESGAVSLLLLQRPFVILGTLSFSIYMIHIFVEGRVDNLLHLMKIRLDRAVDADVGHALITRRWPFPLASDAVTVLTLAAVVAVAFFTFRFIEEPGRRWSRRVVGGREKAPRPGATTADVPAPAG